MTNDKPKANALPSQSSARALRALLERDVLTIMPAAYDALSARLIEQAGFEAVSMSGFGISASGLAMPDMGLISYDEALRAARAMCEAVRIPLLADADTGFGNEMNVRRTIHGFARAGCAAVMIEDQSFPKRCGLMKGGSVIGRDEARARLRAATAARDEVGELLIVGRTDSAGCLGVEEAIYRAQMFEDLGCDIIYMVGWRERTELERFCHAVSAPKLYAIVEGAGEPLPTYAELHDMGYRLAVWALTLLNTSMFAMKRALGELKRGAVHEGILPFSELCDTLGASEYNSRMEALEQDVPARERSPRGAGR